MYERLECVIDNQNLVLFSCPKGRRGFFPFKGFPRKTCLLHALIDVRSLFILTIIILTINAIRFVKARNHFINIIRLSVTTLILLLLSIDPNKHVLGESGAKSKNV